MHGFEVNWAAVGEATVARFAIGGVWYAPFAFGPRWQALVGVDAAAAKARMGPAMAVDFVAGLVLAWVLANLLLFLHVDRAMAGARVSFFLWLGFVAMPFLSMTVYEGRKLLLYAITAGYWLVALSAMGALVAG